MEREKKELITKEIEDFIHHRSDSKSGAHSRT